MDRLFDHGEGLFEVNPSRLQCYLDCPRQYHFRYVQRRTERRTSPHASLGRSVHKALRDFYALPPADRTLSSLLTALRNAWEGSGFATRAESREAQRRAEEMLRRYHDSQDHAAVRPLALESKFSVPFVEEGILLTGRIDRLDADDDGYVIVDYKTGTYRQDAASVDASLGLSVYAMAVSGTMGREVSRIVLHHLASGERAETVRGPDRLADDRRALAGHVRRIRSDADFAPTPGPLCRWCDYLSVCPEGRDHTGRAQDGSSVGTQT